MPESLPRQSSSGRITAAQVLASLRQQLAEMELHDDLPDSFDLGYMQAWREIRDWANKEPWR